MAMKENTKKILTYLQENNSKDMTAEDVGAALDLTAKQVVGSFNSFVKKDWGYREEAEVEVENDGKISHKVVKFLHLTETGMAVDPEAEEKAE